jgi:hypothetical protein
MRRHRWYSVAAAAVIALALAAPAAAQTQGLEARVSALADDVEELRELAVQAPPVAAAVEALSEAVAELEAEVGALGRQQRAIPEAIETIDELEARVRELERELGQLRTHLADLEQPVIATRGGSVTRDGGFRWETDDGKYGLTLFGRAQPRYELEVAEGFDEAEAQGFRLRRARLGADGHLGGQSLRYQLQLDLLSTPLLDAILDYEVREELVLRVGQYKIPFTRARLTSGGNLGFAERPEAVNALRYDRDVGASAHGQVAGGRLGYHAGVANGTGQTRRNDSLDLLTFARADAVLFGERFGNRIADLTASRETSLMAGTSVVYDMARIPDAVGGVPVGTIDVDADGERDAIRVTSASVDVAFAHRGLDITLEGLWRRENWGAILDHPANAALAAWVGGGVEHYLGGYGHVTYALLPELLVIGARAGGVDQPLLGVGGRDPARPREAGAPPRVDMLWEAGAAGRLYREGRPILGLDYSYFRHDLSGAGVAHRVILEAQFDL